VTNLKLAVAQGDARRSPVASNQGLSFSGGLSAQIQANGCAIRQSEKSTTYRPKYPPQNRIFRNVVGRLSRGGKVDLRWRQGKFNVKPLNI